MRISIIGESCKESEPVLHLVRVPAGFGCGELLVGETPITEAQWADVMGGEAKKPNYPKVNVSALEAEEFCEKLSKQTGMRFRLPTEVEQLRCLGEEPSNIEEYAVFGQDSLKPVKTKKPNEYGLFDMRGLVWEWTAAFRCGKHRYMRGGSWDTWLVDVQARFRDFASPTYSDDQLGFRVIAQD